MRAHVLRNTLISILVALFSITATSCGRQALSPIPPQRKKIVIHELPWVNEVGDFVFGLPGACIALLLLARWGYTKWGKPDVAEQELVALRHRRAPQL